MLVHKSRIFTIYCTDELVENYAKCEAISLTSQAAINTRARGAAARSTGAAPLPTRGALYLRLGPDCWATGLQLSTAAGGGGPRRASERREGEGTFTGGERRTEVGRQGERLGEREGEGLEN